MNVEVPVSSEPIPELHLCLLTGVNPEPPRRLAGIAVASVCLNVLFLLLVSTLATIEGTPPAPPSRPVDYRAKATPLISPFTQKAPNKKEVAKEMKLEQLEAKPEVKPAVAKKFTPPPVARPVPQAPPTPTPVVPEPPQTKMAQALPPALGVNPNLPPPPAPAPQTQPAEKPKLAFETPGNPNASPNPPGAGKIAPPKASVEDAIRSIAHSGAAGMVIGDMPDESLSAQTLARNPAAGRQASNIELLSDPMGVDFKPYLIRVLAAVRKNWFAVIPESVHYGRRGKVSIQFSINRAGSVPKLVIVLPSGTEALDRAAIAGISASNPFPPLPAEFHGDLIRLQLAFYYNATTR
jgi:TonB family protein